MIPLKDDIPSRTTPVVNYALIALNVVLFGYQFMLGDAGDMALIQRWGLKPVEVEALLGGQGGSWWPLLTSMFLHGGLLHLGGNMLFLWVFGDNVEDRLGHLRYLLLYLGFGVAASALHVALSPGSAIPTIGASGAISGVLGAYLIFYPRARVKALIPVFIIMLYRELPALLFLGFWFLFQFFGGVASLGASGGGVAWWAHVGGFMAGAGVALLMRLTGPPPTRRAPSLDGIEDAEFTELPGSWDPHR